MGSVWDPSAYDRVAAPMTERGLELVDALELEGTEIVMDAGCGTGQVTERLLARLPRGGVIALDASQAMLDRAAERLADPRVTFVRADLGQPLPLDQPVDAMVSTSTFHWVTDHRALFRHLAAALRPGGTLTAEYGGAGNLENVYRHVRALGLTEAGKRYADVAETLAALAAAGFVDVRAELIPRPATIPREQLREFLGSVTLKEYDDDVVDEVARRMPEPDLDYVRMVVQGTASGSARMRRATASRWTSSGPS
jgi:trans-aconitate 2-methyltransferase